MAGYYRVTVARTIVQAEEGDGDRLMVLAGTVGVAVGFRKDTILVKLPALVADVNNEEEAHGEDCTLAVDPEDLTFESISD